MQSYPRQNGLALDLRELGRIERTLFTLDLLQSVELRRRVHARLSNGETRNARARAPSLTHRRWSMQNRCWPLARTQARWPDYKRCVQAMSDWTGALGLSNVLASSDVALMACRGARYHHDGAQYGGAAFCNLFLSEDKGLDLHFPSTGLHIPLTRGTAVIFDTGHPHGVIQRRSSGFSMADFGPDQDCIQIFLTWELPIQDAHVARALEVAFDIDTSASLQRDEEQVLLNGAPAAVCPESGRWYRVD